MIIFSTSWCHPFYPSWDWIFVYFRELFKLDWVKCLLVSVDSFGLIISDDRFSSCVRNAFRRNFKSWNVGWEFLLSSDVCFIPQTEFDISEVPVEERVVKLLFHYEMSVIFYRDLHTIIDHGFNLICNWEENKGSSSTCVTCSLIGVVNVVPLTIEMVFIRDVLNIVVNLTIVSSEMIETTSNP